jgi:hypothetical protein
MTPSLLENPEDIYREMVTFSISMNGYDYAYEHNSFDFTFIGTASWISMGPIIMGIILVGVVIGAFVYCVYTLNVRVSMHNNSADPYT